MTRKTDRARQGNGQHIVNYGGPGGARLELIPAYNWEVIRGASAVRHCLRPQGDGDKAWAIGRPFSSNTA